MKSCRQCGVADAANEAVKSASGYAYARTSDPSLLIHLMISCHTARRRLSTRPDKEGPIFAVQTEMPQHNAPAEQEGRGPHTPQAALRPRIPRLRTSRLAFLPRFSGGMGLQDVRRTV